MYEINEFYKIFFANNFKKNLIIKLYTIYFILLLPENCIYNSKYQKESIQNNLTQNLTRLTLTHITHLTHIIQVTTLLETLSGDHPVNTHQVALMCNPTVCAISDKCHFYSACKYHVYLCKFQTPLHSSHLTPAPTYNHHLSRYHGVHVILVM